MTRDRLMTINCRAWCWGFVLLTFIFLSCDEGSGEKKRERGTDLPAMDDLTFRNPPADFRSFPFYAINDSLGEAEIATQVRGFKEAGFGGFYLHSREGLITEFLGDEWWKIMEAAVRAGREAGISAMFYDEDKWPSGYAGGIIPDMTPDFRARCLARLFNQTPLPAGAEVIARDSTYTYVVYTAQPGYDIFNGTCYVDLFNPEMVRAFVKTSYLPYAERFTRGNGSARFAIFTDEPHVHARYFDKNTPHAGLLSWSPWLEKKFSELNGYSLRDSLALLFTEKGNWRQVRLRYYQAKALLFEESFSRQISHWCADNDLIFTGHFLGEDGLEKIRDRIGNSMLHYRNMQQPGIDHLGLSIDDRLITARNLSSTANQYGKVKRLSELFGISGQNINFTDRQWIAGWHAVLGINHFCPHLTLYSMKGARKRDYPPTFSYHQPWWNYNKKIEDYLARIAHAASIGSYNPQILVVSPLESEYIKGSGEWEFTAGMASILEVLQNHHYDYDIGDEQIMADTANVQNGRVTIGAMSYRLIILPSMLSLRETTFQLISRFYRQGGIIMGTGRLPRYFDGLENRERLEELKKMVILTTPESLTRELASRIEAPVKIKGPRAGTVWSQTRTTPKGKLLLLFNTSRTDPAIIELAADFPGGNPMVWDPASARCYRLPAKSTSFSLRMEPAATLWITSGELSRNARVKAPYYLPGETARVAVLDGHWRGKRLDPNAITLDFASYTAGNGNEFSASEPVIAIFSRLSEHKYKGPLTLRYPVLIEEIPSRCRLVLEQPGLFHSLKINGREFTFSGDGHFIDHQFISADITPFLIQGKNSIQMTLDFFPPQPASKDPAERYGTEIESIYLTGDFAVSGIPLNPMNDSQRNRTGNFPPRAVHRFSGFALTAEKALFTGDLTPEGYPFYAGSFRLSHSFTLDSCDRDYRYFAELPDVESIVSVVTVNGHVADTLGWPPFKTDITRFLKNGENILEITLVNSLRNLLGPHHHKGGELVKVGPGSFTGAGGFPDGRGEQDWYDLRKQKKNTAIWSDTYHHIPFGILDTVIISRSRQNPEKTSRR